MNQLVGLLKLAKENAYALGWKLVSENSNEVISRDDLRKKVQTAFEGWSMEWDVRVEDSKRMTASSSEVIDHLTNFLWSWIGWGGWDANK